MAARLDHLGARWRTATALTLLAAAVLGGCGSETSVDENSSGTPGAASAAAPSGRQQPANAPDLPPPTAEPDNDVVNAALLGLSLQAAEAKAAEAGYTTRIASVDGEGRALTMDYRFDRINLELEGGSVSRAYVS